MRSLVLAFLCVAPCLGDHSGAYSSPQYAKKMYPNALENGLLPKDRPPIPYKAHSQRPNIGTEDQEVEKSLVEGTNGSSPEGRASFLSSAASFLSGSGGQVVSELAKEWVSRSTGGSSQVLSLNLTNLVILVVLKALILAAGFFGAGAWKGGHGYGRSLQDNKNADYISEEEIQLFLGYLRAQQAGDYGCLQLACCQRPQQAALYTSGADLLLRSARLLRGDEIDVSKMELLADAAREAVSWGEKGMPCYQRYKCNDIVKRDV